MVSNVGKVVMWLGKQTSDICQVNALLVAAFVFSNHLRWRENSWLARLVSTVDYTLAQQLINIAQKNKVNFEIETLVNLFECVISPHDRVINGSIYTPKYIRQRIIYQCLDHYPAQKLDKLRIADIACGCGGFLMDVAKLIHQKTGKSFGDIYKENIFGIDIQDYSIERTKILLTLLADLYGETADFEFNLIQADTLDFCSENWNPLYSSFDVIVGNPPYVCSRNVSVETRNKMLRYEVSRSGHPDLYIPFFQIAIQMLKTRGKLGYITMNSFLRSVNGRKLREFFANNSYDISIIDFRGYQIFPTKSTYTCLFYLQRGKISKCIRYVTCENGNLTKCNNFGSIKYSLLNHKKGWALNDFENTLAQEMVGIPLGKLCKSRHGIATLCNKVYIFKPVCEDGCYYYFLDNNQYVKIEKGICRDIVNSNKLNSAVEFDSIIEKVIYPYQKLADGHVEVLSDETFRQSYPCAYAYLQSHREELRKRDKGNQSRYPAWFAYGRTQSLQMPKYKLFFPKFANKQLKTVLVDAPEMFLYNGVAFVSDSLSQLQIVQRVLESADFWHYITCNAKPYANDYYSVCGPDIMNYGVIARE